MIVIREAPTVFAPFLDILVLHASVLICPEEHVRTLQRIHELTGRIRRSLVSNRGLWLLVMTHNRPEREQAKQLTLALMTACQGVRAVSESSPAATSKAALVFHRRHYPDVANHERPARILVLGSARERHLFGSISTAEPS